MEVVRLCEAGSRSLRRYRCGASCVDTGEEEGRELGSPSEVAEQMIRLNRRLGVNHIVASIHWPGMPNSLALDQLQILAEDVMPQVREAI